ncbi:hypothetical protein SLS64_009650 [Diaporthe eres]|uniref:Uncharacterized protein n=1 Tax=Diaporthe eres TaxID=83184 RepID=A0ABR1NZG2_DIAER
MRPLAAISPPPDSDEVYYLRASIPAIHDIAISGPFHVLEAALPNLRLRLAESSEATEVFNAVTENGRLLNQFCHARGPIDEIPEYFIPVELLRVSEAQLKRALPCPVHRVISSEPFLDAAGQPAQSPRPAGGMCVEDMQLIGSYVSAAAAKARVNQALDARMSDHPVALPKHVAAVDEGQGAMGVIITCSGNSTPVVSFIVMVSYDSGVMLDLDGNEM